MFNKEPESKSQTIDVDVDARGILDRLCKIEKALNITPNDIGPFHIPYPFTDPPTTIKLLEKRVERLKLELKALEWRVRKQEGK